MKKNAKVKKPVQSGLADERFTHLKSDPKFSTLSNKNKKVVIEKRFASALTDAKFSNRAPVDKRGRRMKKTTGNDLLDLYEVEKESDDEVPHKRSKADITSEADSDDEIPIKLDLARGEGNLSSSDDSDSDSDWDLPESLQMDMDLAHLDHDAERVEWASRRLAACNLDWKIIKAEDIMVLVNSFKPPGGHVEKISIYLSDFGKERLAEEDKYGPRLNINKPIEEIEEGDELDPETRAAVRKYQLDLLKYYYAVIECDSEETATAIYEQCDGFQFETSGLKMDLRFIPDEMEFEEDRLKERIGESDVNLDKYKSKEKIRSGVSQTDGKVAWDENDDERAKKFEEAFKKDEAAGVDLIADSDSDDEETTRSRREALRALLTQGDDEEQIEVAWDDNVDKKNEEESDDSDIEKALARRNQGESSDEEEEEEEEKPELIKIDKKKGNYKNYLEQKKQKRKERKQQARAAKEAEREALQGVEEATRLRQKAERARKQIKPTEETAEKVVADERFKALFTDSAFAIEQSAKEFKGSKLIRKQADIKKNNKVEQKMPDDPLTRLKQKAALWEQKKKKKI